jgi:glycosyltransferase involved in cell wall biosynthesis
MTKKTAIIFYAGFVRFGGVISHVKSLNNELLRLGWSVNVVTLDKLPLWCRYIPHLTEKIINIINKPMGFLYKDRVTRSLYKLFFNKKVDLQIFEDIYISWNSNIPSITILHAIWSDNLQSFSVCPVQEYKLKEREVKIIESIHHPVATVSHPYLKYIKESHFPYKINKNIDVIELGIDQSLFKKHNVINNKSIIYVGSLEIRKNIRFLLQVFKKLLEKDASYSLTIIGDGPQRRKLEDFAKFNSLNVSFLGALSHDCVIDEMLKHKIYLHTSIKESFSYALLEAKLAGLKTCAYAKLQVPSDFIDMPIITMEVDDWCNGILNIDFVEQAFNSSNYTVQRMTSQTLKLSIK